MTSRASTVIAADLPVAQVCVDVTPRHLDRLFEYLVPQGLAADAQPGVRVKVRFAGREVPGWVLGRTQTAEHDGRLVPLRKVVSAEPVLTPQVAVLARAVADRYAGTMADVLRLAVPPRHARVESEPDQTTPVLAPPEGSPVDPGPVDPGRAATGGDQPGRVLPPPSPDTDAWSTYRGGAAFCRHLRDGGAPRAVWSALPGWPRPDGAGWVDWPVAVAQAVAACVLGGRGALVVLPDARDVTRVCAALAAVGLPERLRGSLGGTVRLEASMGPARRYRAFLAAVRGRADVVVGTRAAAFAPVRDLGLAVCWDDGDDLHAEPRAPYPHVREVLSLRAELEGCGLLLGAFGRSVPAQGLVERGWAHAVTADRPVLRERTPRVRALTSVELAREGPAAAARLPSPAWRAVRDALADGPVLVQVPRAGYLPLVACARCRAAAVCGACHGPLRLAGARHTPACTWCGRLAGDWRCGSCGFDGLRAVRVGSQRTAEELGRAFPGVTVRVSGAGVRPVPSLGAADPTGSPSRATGADQRPAAPADDPGAHTAEPDISGNQLRNESGNSGSWLPTDRPGGPASAQAGVLDQVPARPALVVATPGAEPVAAGGYAAAVLLDAQVGAGLRDETETLRRWLAAAALVRADGEVLLVGDGPHRPTQALVRWDPAWLASLDLAERVELGLPPAVRVATLTGTRAALRTVVDRIDIPQVTRLGPVPDPTVDEPDAVRLLLRAPLRQGSALTTALAASLNVRSARREPGTLRVRVDPADLR
ncbi:MAG: primosomal protein N' [Cellulomonas sp.]|nr:primosomal protein N' [Cellulomonas sp.]